MSRTPVLTDHPQPSRTRTRYGGTGTRAPVEAVSVQGAGTTLPTSGMAAQAIAFFGLDSTDPTTPPTSPPSTPTPPTTPPTGAACRGGYTVTGWNTGLTAALTVTNTGGTAVDGWSLAFTLPPDRPVTSGWNASYSPASGAVTARNTAYNAAVAPGGSVSLGFQATHTGDTGAPTDFTLNGTPCTLG